MTSQENFKIQDLNEWFNEIIFKAELVDIRYNIKGFTVFRPWSVFSMSKMFKIFEDKLNETGHQQVIMPTLIPEENFLKESEHIEGFIPEVFWVTKHGDEDFEQKYALRPTSETAFYYMFKYWIQSYRDLPLKTYQRANIFRYDSKSTKPFIRGREFHWYEAHNIFETFEESVNQVYEDMQITDEILYQRFGMPFIFFKRPQWDKFPGAIDTFAADVILDNGRLLQLPSTHLLGTKFTEVFNVKYKTKDEKLEYPFGTCYGPAISRIYGGMICVHGDSLGIRIPFELAPIQIIIVPLYFANFDSTKLEAFCLDIAQDLDKLGYRVKIDDQTEKTPKERFTHYEIKGVPIRLEIGPKDIFSGTIMLFRRDLNEKIKVNVSDVFDQIKKIKDEFLENLKKQANANFENKIVTVNSLENLKEVVDNNHVARAPFCSIDMHGKNCFEELKFQTKGADVRGTRMDTKEVALPEDVCVVCKNKAKEIVYIGKSY